MSTPAAVRVWESNFTLYKRIWKSSLLGSVRAAAALPAGNGCRRRRPGRQQHRRRPARRRQLLRVPGPGADRHDGDDGRRPRGAVAGDGRVHVGRQLRRHVGDPAATRQTSPLACRCGTPPRAALSAGGVAVVLAFFADTRSWGLIPAVVFAVLTGLAFAMPISAWSSTRDSDISFPADHALRHRADVPVRRRLLSHRPTPRLAAAGCQGDAAVARRRAVPRLGARHAGSA